MNSKTILKKIEIKKNEMKKFGVKKIGLFGSYAKGKQKKSSDIDILITFDKIDFDNYMDVMFFLKKLLKKRIDLVIEKNLIPELKYVKEEAEYVQL